MTNGLGTPVRLAALVAAMFLLSAFLVYVVRVDPTDLTWLVFTLTAFAWLSFIVLGRAALLPPAIGALTERTFIAFVIAMLGTVACLIVLNTDAGMPYFDRVTASLLFRLAIIAVLAVPTAWLVLWLTGRLGEGGEG